MIHAPCMLPDEDARGYWGRVLRLNAVPATGRSETSFTMCVRRQVAGKSGVPSDVAAAISAVAGLPLAGLVQAHTVVPYLGAVAGTVNADWCDSSYQSRYLRDRGTTNRVYSPAICPMCTDEDLDFWGFSYWRRSHQIVGLVLCQKHECPLLLGAKAETWQTMPHELWNQGKPESGAVCADAMQNPFLRRYADICTELLHRSRPFSGLQVIRSLIPRARAHGIAIEARESGARLSDLAIERVSGAWQQRYWAELSNKPYAICFSPLDDVLTRHYGESWRYGYALAVALLHESTEEAFNSLMRPLPTYDSLLPFLDKDPFLVIRSARTQDRDCADTRSARLRSAINLVLGGLTLDAAALSVGSSSVSVGQTLVRCLAAEQQTCGPGAITAISSS